jgi:hypothetical protein
VSGGSTGRYHFLAWSRRGIGASIANPDAGVLPARASSSVQLALSVGQAGAPSPTQPAPVAVELFGPGDVIGFEARHVIRTEPRDRAVSCEPNYLCGIEFDTPDLPWLCTPAAPVGDRLHPWLALVVLKAEELSLPAIAPHPLPEVDVLTLAGLPDLADSWNWAHVQVSGDTPLAGALASAPGSVISRLLCPRRLDPETSYSAFLVPAFEIGRQAGLGMDVSAIATAEPAWTRATAVPLRLPYYYRFDFHTSDAGDFESLVRRLTPRVLPDKVGQRAMDVSSATSRVRSAGPPLGLPGALASLATRPTPWNDPDKASFQADLEAFVDHPDASFDPAAPDPVVAPPIYGRWHAAVQAVERTAAGWVDDLNLDPRDRSAGGMGTQVVQVERTALLAAAWQQVEGVRQANDVLRQAQLARAALQQIYRRRLLPALPETVMAVTAPLHAKLLAGPRTVLATVRASGVPERLLSAAFRRATRPRRRRGPAPAARPALLARVSSGEVAVVPPPRPPGGLVSLDSVAASALSQATAAALSPRREVLLQQARLAGAVQPVSFTGGAAAAAPPSPGFAVTAAGVAPVAGAGGGTAAGAVDSAPAAAFRGATAELFTAFAAAPADAPPAPALALAPLKTTLMARLDPAATVPRRVQALLAFAPGLSWTAADPLEPIMAAPAFPQPMYAPLRDLSTSYVLPGVELVPPDTLGLLQANQRFIEGYMVGLNHEMARQLLWSDYPTDQRGSYFRQFWDVSSYVPQATDPADPAALRERLEDIPPIHTWPPPSALGTHPNRTGVAADAVVLLVRGELFRRYPNAIVYAGKAKLAGSSRVLDDTDERYPIFRGVLPDDITFLGFNLSREDARGGTAQSPAGFFFVFQEQPTEPRFGLEPVEAAAGVTTRWADLAWTSFAGGGSGSSGGAGSGGSGGGAGVFRLPDLGLTTRARTIAASPWRLASQVMSLVVGGTAVPDFLSPGLAPARVAIDPGAGSPGPLDRDSRWGVNSAQTAAILLRLPFRILIHADLMMPAS